MVKLQRSALFHVVSVTTVLIVGFPEQAAFARLAEEKISDAKSHKIA